MSEPIVEQIAEWLVSAIGDITETNGYQQTLAIARPGDLEEDEKSVADLTTIVGLEDPENGSQTAQNRRRWVQRFGVLTYFVGQGGTDLSIDKRINRVRSDIEKRLGLELANRKGERSLCNNLADHIEIRPPEIWPNTESQTTLLVCHVAIAYSVDPRDPYTQN